MKNKEWYSVLMFICFVICIIPIAGILLCLAGISTFLDWFLSRKDEYR